MTMREVADIRKKMKKAERSGNYLERFNLCEKLHEVLRRMYGLNGPDEGNSKKSPISHK